ncbi:hypothetical protein C5F50_03155 [Nitrosopumilus ureiphilus]|uniref:Uncharacterized protein n=2 Tax=Nitrosopumilus ureiphilus TaxID=1470067 RepID=A0A7D5M6J5_9ARCH|nr:hypothetical protein C5F50_03155 [Nitrosopumilus ureiphilus]
MGKVDGSYLGSMIDILSILSKPDALSIFILAQDGIPSEIESHSKIGITQKQYYTRLHQLVDSGLITKTTTKKQRGLQKQYIHSGLGNMIYKNYVQNLPHTIKDSKELEILEVLKSSKKFDDAEITKIASKIGIHEKTTTTNTKDDTFFIAAKYNEMSQIIIDAINDATKEIILASRFSDESIIGAMIKKAQRGVSVTVLADESMVKNYNKNEKIKNDKNKKERIQIVSDPFYPAKIKRKYGNIPFCILIVDQKFVGWELVDSSDVTKFDKAMFCYNFMLAKDMIETFSGWWKLAREESPIVQKMSKKT